MLDKDMMNKVLHDNGWKLNEHLMYIHPHPGIEETFDLEGAFFFHMYMTNRGFRRSVNKDAKKKGVKIND